MKKQPAKKHLSRSNIIYIILLLCWVFVAMIASQYIIGFPMLWILGHKFTQPLYSGIYFALTYALTLFLTLYALPKTIQLWQKYHPKQKVTDNFRPNATELGVAKWPTFTDIGLAPIGYIVYIVLSSLLMNIMSIFPWFNASESQDLGFSYFITNLDRTIAMIAIVIIAPIAEEVIMRGWLYGKLRNKLKIPLAMLLTSLLFSVLHGQWNVGVGVFALSLVLCTLREITGTIWSGMLLHILSNGIAFYLVYIAGTF